MKSILHSARRNVLSKHLKVQSVRRTTIICERYYSAFFTEVSHYSRSNDPNRRHLSSALTTQKMYSCYTEWVKDTHPVSSSLHLKVFCNEFNLDFDTPRILLIVIPIQSVTM